MKSKLLEDVIKLAQEIENIPLENAFSSNDPDIESICLRAFKDVSRKFYHCAKRIHDSELQDRLENINIHLQFIDEACDLKVDLLDIAEIVKEIQIDPQRKENIHYKTNYIDSNRLKELEQIDSKEFDLTKLIQICKELNTAYTNKMYFSVAILFRALIDHVPPIFRQKNFENVVAQHGNKSFKDSMQNLEKSLRKISDGILHTHIRDKEVLANQTQVDFKNDLDVLLAEICRILK